MKNLVIGIALFSLPLLCISQTDTNVITGGKKLNEFVYFNKGHNIIALDIPAIGLGSNNAISFSVGARYGRFWLNKFIAGMGISFSSNGDWHTSFGASPFLRYYILNKKFSPFVETKYGYGWFKKSNNVTGSDRIEWTGTSHSIWFGSGIAYTGILKRFGIELYAGYSISKRYIPNPPKNITLEKVKSGNGFVYGVRFNYHF